MCVDNIVSPIVKKLGNSIPGFYRVFLLHQLKKKLKAPIRSAIWGSQGEPLFIFLLYDIDIKLFRLKHKYNNIVEIDSVWQRDENKIFNLNFVWTCFKSDY